MEMTGCHTQGSFPLFIQPTSPMTDYNEALQWLKTNRNALRQLSLKHGALVFRNFPVHDAKAFSQWIETMAWGEFVNYIGGDSPRNRVEGKVYTSTEAPPAFHIPLHQELSFIKKFPSHIYFFCEIAPTVGGSTIIGDARQIFRDIDPHVLQQFKERNLTYISHYYYQSKVMEWLNRIQRSHKSWTEVFETDDRTMVEKKCIDNEFAWRWLSHDWLEIKQARPATLLHPETQDEVWFNQAHLYDFNPRLLGWKRYFGAKLFYFRPSTRLHDIKYGDYNDVPRKHIYHILDVLQKNTVSFPWQKGDVMVLDNILAMHGRAPFAGKRRVLAAMTSQPPRDM